MTSAIAIQQTEVRPSNTPRAISAALSQASVGMMYVAGSHSHVAAVDDSGIVDVAVGLVVVVVVDDAIVVSLNEITSNFALSVSQQVLLIRS